MRDVSMRDTVHVRPTTLQVDYVHGSGTRQAFSVDPYDYTFRLVNTVTVRAATYWFRRLKWRALMIPWIAKLLRAYGCDIHVAIEHIIAYLGTGRKGEKKCLIAYQDFASQEHHREGAGWKGNIPNMSKY